MASTTLGSFRMCCWVMKISASALPIDTSTLDAMWVSSSEHWIRAVPNRRSSWLTASSFSREFGDELLAADGKKADARGDRTGADRNALEMLRSFLPAGALFGHAASLLKCTMPARHREKSNRIGSMASQTRSETVISSAIFQSTEFRSVSPSSREIRATWISTGMIRPDGGMVSHMPRSMPSLFRTIQRRYMFNRLQALPEEGKERR